MDLASYFRVKLMEAGNNFRLAASKQQWVNVCFWYIPDWLLLCEKDMNKDKWNLELGKATVTIAQKVNSSGSFLVRFFINIRLIIHHAMICLRFSEFLAIELRTKATLMS